MAHCVRVQGIEEVRKLISGPCDSKVWLVFLTPAALPQDLHLDVKSFDRWRPVELARTRPFTAPSTSPKTGANSTELSVDVGEEWPQASATLSHALSGSPAELEVTMEVMTLQDVDADGDGRVDNDEFAAYLSANRTVRFGAEFVRVCGVTLCYKGQTKSYKGINGDYYRTHEVANGRAVYVKVNKPTTAMWWTNNNGSLSWGRTALPVPYAPRPLPSPHPPAPVPALGVPSCSRFRPQPRVGLALTYRC